VDLLLSLDDEKKFKYCALQSKRGKELLVQIGKQSDDISTVVLIKSLESNEIYFKSDAVLNVMNQLQSPIFESLALLGTNIIPLTVRDKIYDLVATNRYKFLGKRTECRCGDANANYSDRFVS
jgi:predicted DCC family thiol-disulfide oxidoreductase YuxK